MLMHSTGRWKTGIDVSDYEDGRRIYWPLMAIVLFALFRSSVSTSWLSKHTVVSWPTFKCKCSQSVKWSKLRCIGPKTPSPGWLWCCDDARLIRESTRLDYDRLCLIEGMCFDQSLWSTLFESNCIAGFPIFPGSFHSISIKFVAFQETVASTNFQRFRRKTSSIVTRMQTLNTSAR